MTITNTETYKTIIYTIEDQTTGHEYHVTKSDSWSSDILFPEYNIVDEDNNEVEDQELINRLKRVIEDREHYFELKQEEHPKQIKCYCGHTSYCDCSPLEEPQQETLEEANWKVIGTIRNTFYNGAKWQQERMYSEEEVMEIAKQYAKRCQATIQDTKWLNEQFKKK